MRRSEFFENIDRLNKGERTALKRNCGIMLNHATGQAMIAFYKCLPEGAKQIEEPKWFAVACIYCLCEDNPDRKLQNCFAVMKNDSDSLSSRIAAVLDMDWDEDGLFLMKLTRLIKMAVQKGYSFSCESLLCDLLKWDCEDRVVQRKWARDMYYEAQQNRNGGEENVG